LFDSVLVEIEKGSKIGAKMKLREAWNDAWFEAHTFNSYKPRLSLSFTVIRHPTKNTHAMLGF